MRPRIQPFEDRDTDAVVGLSLRAWAPAFASLEQTLGSEIFRRQHPDWREDQRRAVEDACATKKGRVWVAEAGASAVRFVAVEFDHPERSMGEISMLAVHPDHQGRGIGSALTGFALVRLKSAGMTMAMVETGEDPGHAPARRVYEKAGYTLLPIARYSDPVAAGAHPDPRGGGGCHPYALPGPALNVAFRRLLLPGEWRCTGVSRSL
jgi:GNAT superfamily N-acetyltransferase